MIQELFERAWYQCLDTDRFDIDDLIDLFDSLDQGLCFNPYALGNPHPALNEIGLWVYNTPPLARLPTVYVLYEIIPVIQVVKLWAVRFP